MSYNGVTRRRSVVGYISYEVASAQTPAIINALKEHLVWRTRIALDKSEAWGMPRSGRPKAELVLSAEEREQPTRWASRAKSSQALTLRSRIVLGCADRADNKQIAADLRCNQVTVGKWGKRFIEHRLDGLTDEQRTGRPTSITLEQVEDVIESTLESTPPNATHWTRSKMAERTGLSRTTIGEIWKAFDLKPHRRPRQALRRPAVHRQALRHRRVVT